MNRDAIALEALSGALARLRDGSPELEHFLNGYCQGVRKRIENRLAWLSLQAGGLAKVDPEAAESLWQEINRGHDTVAEQVAAEVDEFLATLQRLRETRLVRTGPAL